MPTERWLRRWGPPTFLALAILLASVIPIPQPEGFDPTGGLPVDLFAHLVGYAALGSTLANATRNWERGTRKRIFLLVVLITGYGALIEGIQVGIPTRHPSLLDSLANAVGAIVGVVFAEQ